MDSLNSLVVSTDETNYDLDDLILFEVGESVRALANMFGPKKIKLGALEIDMPPEDPNVSFEKRLIDVFGFTGYIWEQSTRRYCNIVEELLRLDGWHWSKFSFRTPLWMFDHREIPIEEAYKIKGLEWLKDST